MWRLVCAAHASDAAIKVAEAELRIRVTVKRIR
jgi:hypothetical protein